MVKCGFPKYNIPTFIFPKKVWLYKPAISEIGKILMGKLHSGNLYS